MGLFVSHTFFSINCHHVSKVFGQSGLYDLKQWPRKRTHINKSESISINVLILKVLPSNFESDSFGNLNDGEELVTELFMINFPLEKHVAGCEEIG